MGYLTRFYLLLMSTAAVLGGETSSPAQRHEFDLVIVGGTGAGVAAAIQASRLNLSVALLEESDHIGGMVVEGAGGADLDSQVSLVLVVESLNEEEKKTYIFLLAQLPKLTNNRANGT